MRFEGGTIGQMELPQILPHTIEVFPDHEKLSNNLQS